ncbi:MAG: NAD(P)H-dependent oxidoreductase [Candidatus Sulfotelmatobacter sp.]
MDTVVIGTPMDNFSISSSLKGWIDQIVRIGKGVGYRPIAWPRTDFRFGIECAQTGLSWKRGAERTA